MNLSWSNRVIKYILFVFNLIFVITGIIMIAVGVSVKSYYTDYDIFLNDSYFSLPNLLIAIGSLIFFISFFGCCGAIKENWFMIFIFSVLLSVIFIMELSAGIAGYVLRDKTTSYLTDELRSSMRRYSFNPDKADGNTIAWDKIQETFECCGANGPNDWLSVNKNPSKALALKSNAGNEDTDPPPSPSTNTTTTTTTKPTTTTTTTVKPVTLPADATTPTIKPPPPSNSTNSSVTTLPPEATPTTTNPTTTTQAPIERDKNDLPGSCCKSKPGAAGIITCRINDTTTAWIHQHGCVEEFGDYLKDHAVTIGGVGLAIGFIQLVGVIFACHLTKQLKNGFYST